MEQFGLCQQYRQAVEDGRIKVEELSESVLNARLGAGARNLPFLHRSGVFVFCGKALPDRLGRSDSTLGVYRPS